MDKTTEQILRRRMHGLYLSRKCGDLTQLSYELMGLHCWFHRNVAFSAFIRGADLSGWKNALTKTWLYRGTLHGVNYEDLPLLLALHTRDSFWEQYIGKDKYNEISERVVSLMEDGVFSRAEMRRIFAYDYDDETIAVVFSSWGGIFCGLARQGRVAFRDMTSRDFDLIDAVPTLTPEEALPELFHRYLSAYGPATISDAAWFLGLWRERKKELSALDLSEYVSFKHEGSTYYCIKEDTDMGDIPELTLLSGFDPLIVSYTERSSVLPPEYKSKVILKSGICLPTVAVNGQVAGLWNIKKKAPVIEFFSPQPDRIVKAAYGWVENIAWAGSLK